MRMRTRMISRLQLRAISGPLSDETMKLKIALTIEDIVSTKRTARRGRKRLQFDRLKMIDPLWSAPITLTPADPVAQAILRQRYML